MWQPASIDDYLRRWRLEPRGAGFSTLSSHLQPVLQGGVPAMLKVARIEEEANGCRLLAWWDGSGAARVLEVDAHAALLEEGGASLVTLARSDDDAATRILCGVAETLHAASAGRFADRPQGLIPLDVWFRALFDRADGEGDGFYGRAASTARRLLAENADDTVVLHGDLHHGNVLDFGERGALAIDPKFLVGDRVFDYTNILCNPEQQIAEFQFDRRVDLISALAGIRLSALLEWTVAWTGLSASWFAADGTRENERRALRIGTLAEARLTGERKTS
ncbi:streptomycin 6-kinase [Mycetocola sp. CAN_C7]|uniref:aminoglycoside phosphotransferase family protein n=1 Tax=Mycetocola sp. CAN_C7 TaxID=2787724 RepID=UPI0018CBE470